MFPTLSTLCPKAFPYYVFSPDSDIVTAYSNSAYGPQPYTQFNMSMSIDTPGYYPTTAEPLTPLPKGDYTLVAGDEWGSTAFLFLRVS